MRTFKDSGLSWIPQIPENWTINRLKVLFQYSKGLGITKEDLIDEGIPVISYGQVHSKDNNGTEHNPALEKFVAETYLDTDADCLVNKGDFIFADTSEDLEGCGNCTYISEQKTLFAGYHTIVLSSQCGNDNKYLAYLFKSDIWRSQIRKNVNCVKVYSVTKSILNNITVVLPPIEEQQQIVTYLDARCSKIDGAVAQRKAIIEKLKEYKSAVITKAVTKGLNSEAEMKDSGVEWIGNIPKHWDTTRLKFVTQIRKEKALMPENARYIGLENIKSGYNELVDTETTYDEGKQSVCKIGDVLFNKLRPYLNKVFIAPYDAYCTNELLVFSNYSGSKKYLRYLMSSVAFIEKVMSITEGTKMPRADGDSILSFWVVNPNPTEQEAIADYLDSQCAKIDEAIEKQEQAVAKLEEYRKSVIYYAVTGKIDCRDKENIA